MDAETVRKLEVLLTRSSRALGLRLCYHDRINQTGGTLSGSWRSHSNPCCRAVKLKHESRCVAYDAGEVHRALAGMPEGRIHTCPSGMTEMAVPVISGGVYAGVLFAGQCWRGRGAPPHPAMITVRDGNWLHDRLVLIRGVASQFAAIIAGPAKLPEGDRRQSINNFIRARLSGPLYLADLARHLSLSPSRARHVVTELYGLTFSGLTQAVRLREAAHILRTTDLPVGEVADRCGYEDRNYFSRVFAREFKLSPRSYRRKYAAEA